MNEQAQRIAIAKFCGWQESIGRRGRAQEDVSIWPVWSLNGVEGELPDYTRDLNAMHEAEAKLQGREQFDAYNDAIYDAMRVTAMTSPDDLADWPFHASAAVRAEALLRTLGLWTEDAP